VVVTARTKKERGTEKGAPRRTAMATVMVWTRTERVTRARTTSAATWPEPA
jgi:hypothetical protein